MFGSKPLTAALAVLLLCASVVPATAAAGGEAEGSAAASATVHVEVTENATILTVESEGEAVSIADIAVGSVDNTSYEGSGEHETGADGEVRLPAPDGEATVRVELDSESVDGEAVVTLTASEQGDYETTVRIEGQAEAGVLADLQAWLPIEFGFDADYEADSENGSVSTEGQAHAESTESDDSDSLFGLDLAFETATSVDDETEGETDTETNAESETDDESDTSVAGDADSETDGDESVEADSESSGSISVSA